MLLNLLLLSVGYFLIGQWKKGIAVIALGACIVLPTLGYGLPLLAIFTAVDGYKQAALLGAGQRIGQWSWFGKRI